MASWRLDALALALRYLAFIVPANFTWEAVQLPLYTLWADGTAWDMAYAVLHCTAGDAMIALASLGVAVLVLRQWRWPSDGFSRVLLAATAIGLAYTVFSEWLNVQWRENWAYAAAMPRLPVLGTGLSPVLQWLVLPPLCLLAVRRLAARPPEPEGLP